MRLIIEEFAGEHSYLMHVASPPMCKCLGGGEGIMGSDSCLYCGRYLHGLYSAVVSRADDDFASWERFVKEGPS